MPTPAPANAAPGWRSYLDRPLVRFALIALALYAVWFLVYEAWLGPDGRLDFFAAHVVAQGSAAVLRLIGYGTAYVEGDLVWARENVGAWVTTGCNGLSSIALFAGFVLAYPGTWRRRALFIPAGALLIFVANVIRVTALVVIIDRWPQYEETAHALVAPSVFYVVVFVLWILWVRFGGGPAEPATVEAAPAATQPA